MVVARRKLAKGIVSRPDPHGLEPRFPRRPGASQNPPAGRPPPTRINQPGRPRAGPRRPRRLRMTSLFAAPFRLQRLPSRCASSGRCARSARRRRPAAPTGLAPELVPASSGHRGELVRVLGPVRVPGPVPASSGWCASPARCPRPRAGARPRAGVSRRGVVARPRHGEDRAQSIPLRLSARASWDKLRALLLGRRAGRGRSLARGARPPPPRGEHSVDGPLRGALGRSCSRSRIDLRGMVIASHSAWLGASGADQYIALPYPRSSSTGPTYRPHPAGTRNP